MSYDIEYCTKLLILRKRHDQFSIISTHAAHKSIPPPCHLAAIMEVNKSPPMLAKASFLKG